MSTGDSIAPSELVSIDAIKVAHKQILPFIHRTPLLTSNTLDAIATERLQKETNERLKISLAFKSEHLQVVGAFKIRGATNAVLTHLKRLQDSHGAAVACAARQVGAKAAVVMPRTAPQIKKSAVANYGARIVESEPTQEARESTAQALKDEIESDGSGTVVRFIHPYDEDLVIAGQGTMGLEIIQQAYQLDSGSRRSCSVAQDNVRVEDDKAWSSRDSEQEPPLDFVIAPVGGGGMLSGVSTAIKGVDDRIIVFGAEPKEADDAARSIQTGELKSAITPPRTICDGLLTALSPRTMMHIQRNVKSIFTVSEESILISLRLVWERMKQIIEPSAAVGLAVVLDNEEFVQSVHQWVKSKREQMGWSDEHIVEVRMGVVFTGGNVELDAIVAALQNTNVVKS